MRFFALFLFCLLLPLSYAQAEELTLPIAAPFSGGSASFGEAIKRGAQLAVDEINQQGGILNKKLVLSINDDACDPKQARVIANKLVAQKAPVIFGHWCAGSSMAASAVYGEEKMLQIDIGGLLQKYTHQGFPTLFRVSVDAKNYAEALGRYIVEHNPNSRVAIVTDQPASTTELTQGLEGFLASTPNKIVAVERFKSGDTDFSSIIDKLKMLKTDIVVCSCYTIEAGLLARQLSEKNLDVYYYGWDTLNSPDFLNIVSKIDLKKIAVIDYARPASNPYYEKFAAALQKHNWPVETYSILAYAAVQVYAEAAKAAGSLDPTLVAKALHEKEFSTILGAVAFDAYGERKNLALGIYQWVNGQPKMLELAKTK